MIELHPQIEGVFYAKRVTVDERFPLSQPKLMMLSRLWVQLRGCSNTLSPATHLPPLSAANSSELGSFAHNVAETQLQQTCYFVSCVDPWILLPFFLYGRWKALSDPTEGENLAGCSLLQDKDINWCQTRRWQQINLTYKPPWVATTP